MLVLEARDRVGGRVLNHQIDGGEISEAGGTFIGPDPGPHQGAGRRRSGVGTFPTYNEGENVYIAGRPAVDLQRPSPLGTAPPDPLVLGRPGDRRRAARRDVEGGAGRRARGRRRSARRVRRPDARHVDQGEHDPNPAALRASSSNAATRPIFGAEPTRDLAAVHALLHRGVGQRAERRDVRAQLQHARRRAGARASSAARRLIATKVAQALGRRVILKLARPPDPQRRARRRRHLRPDQREGQARDRRDPAGAGRPDRLLARTCRPSATRCTQRLPQGTLGKVAAVYDKPFWREKGLTGTALHTRRRR